jgi:light-regulated signal transduction histidine kinase (bacteriophytochrome)
MPVPQNDNALARIAELEAQLERSESEMRDFSHSVSHDLRAPLRAIEGFARILSEDYGNTLDPEGQKFLRYILDNTQRMGSLIESLLMYYRMGAKVVTPIPISMTDLTREVVASLGASVGGKQPEVLLPKLPKITGDPTLIRQAWEQLISNALKFSKRQEKPIVEFGGSESADESVIWVRDNGVGFDIKYADRLGQVFQKLQRDEDFPGNGIGLALVKRIMEKHNGRFWAESAPGKGSTFYIALPA